MTAAYFQLEFRGRSDRTGCLQWQHHETVWGDICTPQPTLFHSSPSGRAVILCSAESQTRLTHKKNSWHCWVHFLFCESTSFPHHRSESISRVSAASLSVLASSLLRNTVLDSCCEICLCVVILGDKSFVCLSISQLSLPKVTAVLPNETGEAPS